MLNDSVATDSAEENGQTPQDPAASQTENSLTAQTSENSSPAEAASLAEARFQELEERLVSDLKPHPLNSVIYGEEIGTDIIESLKSAKIIEPLLITQDDVIVSGHRRWRAAQKRGLQKLPVRILPETDANEIEHLLIESNVQREKTLEQKLREFEFHLKHEAAAAEKRKGFRSDLMTKSSGCQTGPARNIAGKKVGMSGTHAEKGLKILHAIDAKCTGETDALAESIRKVLNTEGIEEAHRQCVAATWIPSAPQKNKPIPNAGADSGQQTPVACAPPDPEQESATAEAPEDEDAGDSDEKPAGNHKPATTPIAIGMILKEIQRDVVRGMTDFGLEALRQFQTELNAFKDGWLSKQAKEVSHV